MIDVREASEKYHYSRSHLVRLARNGDIKARRFGGVWAIDETSLAAYAANPPKSGPHATTPHAGA